MVSSHRADLAQAIQLVGQRDRWWPLPAAITAAGSCLRVPMPRCAFGTPARERWCAPSSSTKGRRPRCPSAIVVHWPEQGRRDRAGGPGAGREDRHVPAGGAPIVSLAFTADPNTFAVAAQDGTVALYDIRAPSAAAVLLDGRDGTGLIVTAARSRDYVASAGSERTIRLWRTDGPNLLRTYRGLGSEITALDISLDGRYVAAAAADGSINVWSNSSSRAVRTLKAHKARIVAIAFGPDRLLATSGEDGKVKLWNLRAGRVLRTSEAARPGARLGFSPAAGVSWPPDRMG